MSKHIKHDTRVQNLEFANSWNHLSDKEKNYAYYMAKASWAGCQVVLHQICYEQVPLFCLFQAYFEGKNFDELKAAALAKGITEE